MKPDAPPSYYWMTGDYSLPMPLKLLHVLKYYVFLLYRLCRFVGDVILHFFGLHKSRFQWAADMVEERRMELEREAVERLAVSRAARRRPNAD
jgi:hypothetical protein